MSKRREYLSRIVIVLIFSVVIIFGRKVFLGYMQTARESEVLTSIAAMVTAQETYHQEFKAYTDNVQAVGYVPEGKLRGTLYLKADDIPSNLRHLLSENDLPLISESTYRILGIFNADDGSVVIFVKDKDQEIRRSEKIIEAF